MMPASEPRCPECGGDGVVLVNVLPLDAFGCPQEILERPCPACAAGDEEAVHRIGLPEFDALSRAAWSPAPVTAEDFLPSHSRPARNLAGPLCDPGDVGGPFGAEPSPGTDLNAEQARGCAPLPFSRDANHVAASPVVLGTGEAHSLQDATRRKRAA